MKKTYFFQTLLALCLTTLALGQKPLATGDHFADLNGVKLHYLVRGEGPVCLLPTPGWGPSINYLKNTLTPLEKYFTMVYYDTRGTGQSTYPTDTTKFTSQDFMDDMEGLRAHLKQPKIWIMGHGTGGFQALNYGIHHSDKLHGIIAISALAGRDSLYEAEYTKMIMKRKGRPYFEKGSAILTGKDTTNYTLAESSSLIFPFFFHDAAKIADFEKLVGAPQLSDKANEHTWAAKFGTEYLFPELHKITVPTLIVVGDDDMGANKVSQADRIHDKMPTSDEIVIKDAGLFCWIEQPEQFFADTGKWLEKHKLRARK